MSARKQVARRSWLAEVEAERGVAPEGIRPRSVRELVGYLDLEPDLVPVAGGRSGTLLPEAAMRWVHLDRLPSAVEVDPVSSTATVRGDITWEALEDAAATHGLTSRLLAGAAPGRGVLSTLARPPLLPPLWLSPVPHARCTGLKAVDRCGVVYEAVAAPRTASGPDFRWLYLGGQGVRGVIVEATVTLDRKSTLRGFRGRAVASMDVFRGLLARAPHRLRAVACPDDRGSLLLVVVGECAESTHLAAAAEEAGLEAVGALPSGCLCPGAPEDEGCWVVTAPWSVGAGILAARGARALCATAQAVAVSVPQRSGKRALEHVAAVERALERWPELVRVTPSGFCVPSESLRRTPLAAGTAEAAAQRDAGGPT